MVLFTLGAAFVYVQAPAFAKLTLEAGPRAYGLVLGAMGLGAVLGATVLKRLRARLVPRRLLSGLMLLYATASIGLSLAPRVSIAIALAVPAGVGWTGTFSSLSALAQVWVPNRIRGRAMALYTMVHLSMWGIGASVSGALAQSWSIRATIFVGGIVCACAGLVASRLPLPRAFVATR